jgi:hypothetical protein
MVRICVVMSLKFGRSREVVDFVDLWAEEK